MIRERFETLPDETIRRHRAVQAGLADWVEVEARVRRVRGWGSLNDPAECP